MLGHSPLSAAPISALTGTDLLGLGLAYISISADGLGVHGAAGSGDSFLLINALGDERVYAYWPVVEDIQFTFQGLSPYEVIQCDTSSVNAWELNWIRRTRVSGEWRDYVEVSLGETLEKYEIEIWNASYTVLKRTLTVYEPTATYTVADQILDFGVAQSTLYVKIYQISELVGRGTPITTSITR